MKCYNFGYLSTDDRLKGNDTSSELNLIVFRSKWLWSMCWLDFKWINHLFIFIFVFGAKSKNQHQQPKQSNSQPINWVGFFYKTQILSLSLPFYTLPLFLSVCLSVSVSVSLSLSHTHTHPICIYLSVSLDTYTGWSEYRTIKSPVYRCFWYLDPHCNPDKGPFTDILLLVLYLNGVLFEWWSDSSHT